MRICTIMKIKEMNKGRKGDRLKIWREERKVRERKEQKINKY